MTRVYHDTIVVIVRFRTVVDNRTVVGVEHDGEVLTVKLGSQVVVQLDVPASATNVRIVVVPIGPVLRDGVGFNVAYRCGDLSRAPLTATIPGRRDFAAAICSVRSS